MFDSDTAFYWNPITAINSNKFAIAYKKGEAGKVILGSLDGSDITFGYSVVFNDTGTLSITIDKISEELICVGYQNGQFGKIKIGSISDLQVSFSLEYIFNNAHTVYVMVRNFNSGLVISYRDVDDNDYGKAFVYLTKSIEGIGTSWNTSWPDNTYEIKFGTTELDGIGTPDTWFTITDTLSPTFLTIDDFIHPGEFLPNGTPYVIRQLY